MTEAGPTGTGRRVPRRPALVVGLLAVVAIVLLVFLTYSFNLELTSSQQRLVDSKRDVESATASLASTRSTLETTQTTLADRSDARAALERTVDDLSAKVATRAHCLSLQRNALSELDRISRSQTANFNRTADDSTWDSADVDRDNAMDDAHDGYYRAYSRAFDRALSTARIEASSAAKALDRAKAARRVMAAEQVKIDAAAVEIKKAIDALEIRLAETTTACREAAP